MLCGSTVSVSITNALPFPTSTQWSSAIGAIVSDILSLLLLVLVVCGITEEDIMEQLLKEFVGLVLILLGVEIVATQRAKEIDGEKGRERAEAATGEMA